jgi:hypothetical protein
MNTAFVEMEGLQSISSQHVSAQTGYHQLTLKEYKW